MSEKKRRFGDRRDGTLIRDADSMHFIMGVIYPNRADNEAYISETIDLTNIKAYIAKKNETETEFPYTFFHVIVGALLKTILLRPQLNRFYVNGNYYQRNYISAGFTVKKKFADDGEEGLAFIPANPDDTLADIHETLRHHIMDIRSPKGNSTGDAMDMFNRLPRFISKAAVRFVMWLDKHGWVPKSLIADDPGYSSVFISNLGSIKLRCGYHHLANWGTNSFFCIIGEKKWTPVYAPDGSFEMRETLDLGLTIDERIADGYYYAKSIRLAKKLLENPELLDLPLATEVDY